MISWWRHQMETYSALLALCEGNPLVIGDFPSQRPVTRSVDVFFDLLPSKWLNRQSKRQWFETPSYSLWRDCNVIPENCVKHTLTITTTYKKGRTLDKVHGVYSTARIKFPSPNTAFYSLVLTASDNMRVSRILTSLMWDMNKKSHPYIFVECIYSFLP